MAGEEQFWLERFSLKQSAWFWVLEIGPGEEWTLKEQGAEDSRGELQPGPRKAGKIDASPESDTLSHKVQALEGGSKAREKSPKAEPGSNQEVGEKDRANQGGFCNC